MRLIQAVDDDGTIVPGVVQGDEALLVERGAHGIQDTRGLLLAIERQDTSAEAWLTAAEGEGRVTRVPWAALAHGRFAGQVAPLAPAPTKGPPARQTAGQAVPRATPHGQASGRAWRLTIPITPPEVWGCGVTYRRSADFREEGLGIYTGVYEAPRPELFYKASPSRSVGPGEPIGRRRDSQFTAAEPEVALVVSAAGDILAYTLANDVSAWDIERENPLYLPQSKIYTGCFSCGPTLVTPDEIADPYTLELTCVITRGDTEIFRGTASTAQLKREFPELVRWLLASNAVPTGTILSSGTGIIQPIGAGLEPDDLVTISCPALGVLVNPVAFV